MALYDRSKTRSFFSEIAHTQDVCYYCEKAIREKRDRREIDLDEMNKELRALVGKLTGVRVPKFRYVGHEFTVCPECLKNICNEVFPKEEKVSDNVDTTIEQSEDVTVNDKSTSKQKGKTKNASKES